MRTFLFVFSFLFLIVSCSEPVHPIYGKWKLGYINDSLVINNPESIYLEFTEQGKIINESSAGGKDEGDFIISNDTTSITVLEEGKPVTEYKIYSLDKENLILKEGDDLIRFVKQEE